MNPIVLHLFQGTLVENHPYLENRWSTRKNPLQLILGYIPTKTFNLSSRISWEHLQNCENVSWEKEYLVTHLTSLYTSLWYSLATITWIITWIIFAFSDLPNACRTLPSDSPWNSDTFWCMEHVNPKNINVFTAFFVSQKYCVVQI